MRLGQHHCVAAVGLYTASDLRRDRRGRDHSAVVTHLDKLAVQATAAGPSLIAEVQFRRGWGKLLHQLADGVRAVRSRCQVPHLAPAHAMRNGDRNRCLADAHPDKRADLHTHSPPFLRLGASQSGAALERRMPRARPLTQSEHPEIMRARAAGSLLGDRGSAQVMSRRSRHKRDRECRLHRVNARHTGRRSKPIPR